MLLNLITFCVHCYQCVSNVWTTLSMIDHLRYFQFYFILFFDYWGRFHGKNLQFLPVGFSSSLIKFRKIFTNSRVNTIKPFSPHPLVPNTKKLDRWPLLILFTLVFHLQLKYGNKEHPKVLHSGRLWPYLQMLDEAEKYCQTQTL
jgi:hypothetical protein